MKTDKINIRDPFVLVENGRYYMYGTRGETAFSKEHPVFIPLKYEAGEWLF